MTAGDTPPSRVAWHGKLPGTGDFASRRLDAAQLEALDSWLARTMLTLAESSPLAWLQRYLESPSWRFLWMPAATPPPWQGRCWAGVLMPSVDSVGRYFPLLLLLPLGRLPASPDEMELLQRWLARLDETAADALEGDWDVNALEQALAALGEPALAGPDADEDPSALSLAPASLAGFAHPGALFAAQAQGLWRQAMRDRCFWYCATDHAAPALLASRGLDQAGLACALFGGARDEPAPAGPGRA